jgi:hypothetical protein
MSAACGVAASNMHVCRQFMRPDVLSSIGACCCVISAIPLVTSIPSNFFFLIPCLIQVPVVGYSAGLYLEVKSSDGYAEGVRADTSDQNSGQEPPPAHIIRYR